MVLPNGKVILIQTKNVTFSFTLIESCDFSLMFSIRLKPIKGRRIKFQKENMSRLTQFYI